MPELPEVETIKRQLGKILLGKRIEEVVINNAYVVKEPSRDSFKKLLKGCRIDNILRKGKLLIFELDSRKFLIVHLRMTGQLVYPGDCTRSRVSFKLSDKKCLDYNDRRMLGDLRLIDDWHDLKFIKQLGPEPFDMSQEEFDKKLLKKTTKIKPLLMDQAFIAGIGNLYAAEVLFKAKISPFRPAKSLSKQQKKKLLTAIKEILKDAIIHKGSSIDQYVTLTGEKGDYVKFHKVYGREDKPCFVCKSSIKRIAQGGRGTYFCPRCQK